MVRQVVAAFALAMAVAVGAVRAETPRDVPPPVSAAARAFAAPPAFYDIAISPSGRRIARIVQRNSLYQIEVLDTARPAAPVAIYVLSRYNSANWLLWKDDDRLLVSGSQPTTRFGFLMFETRLWAFDPTLKRPVILTRRDQNRSVIHATVRDRLIATLPDDPTGALVALDWYTPDQPGVQRFNLETGDATMVLPGRAGVTDWLSDPAGQYFIGMGGEPGHPQIVRSGRSSGVASVPLIGAGSVFRPLAFDGGADRLAVASNHEGGTLGLYRYDLQTGFTETLYKSPDHDAEAVVMSPDGRRVDGVIWTDTQRRIRWLNPEARRRQERIVSLIGGEDASVLSQTPDGRRAVVAAMDGSRTTEVFLVDLEDNTAVSLERMWPSLDAVSTGSVEAVATISSDGTSIPGFLTLPPGVDRAHARRLPFVVLPHGGPHARDSADFDFLAQFFASLGYGVIQPNFRGSAGYGEAFLAAGDRQWSGLVLDDVTAATRWAIDEGLADPKRICVVGWSFGGYLSLMSAADHGDLYRCAAAIAPVTDIPQLIEREALFVGGRSAMERMFGVGWSDFWANRRASPVSRARDMRIPIFLASGSGDDAVPQAQTAQMYAALLTAGGQVEHLDLPGAVHSVTRENDRIRLLSALEAFVATNTAPARPPEAAP